MVISGHIIPSIGVLLASLPGNSRVGGALTQCCQARLGTQQVGKGRWQYRSVVICPQASIATFAVAENSLDYEKRVLAFGQDIGFHPLASLLGFMYLGITCIVFFLGRSRRGKNTRIHDGIFLEREFLSSKVLVDDIGGNLAHGLQLVKCALDAWGTIAAAQLPAAPSQYDRQGVRREATDPLGIVLAELLLQLGARNEFFHALQENFAPRFALLVNNLGFGEGHMNYDDILQLRCSLLSQNS